MASDEPGQRREWFNRKAGSPWGEVKARLTSRE